MNRLTNWTVMAVSVMILAGCAPAPVVEIAKPVADLPEWFLNKPNDPNMIFGVGSGTSSRMQIARDKASQSARFDLAQAIEVKFDGLQKQFTEEIGSGEGSELLEYFVQATKAVVSTVMTGATVDKSKIMQKGDQYIAYALMSMNVSSSNQALLDKLKQQENMYTRFRASETFKEMEAETEKFEDYKKAQGE